MRRIFWSALLLASAASAQPAPELQDMAGNWTVDLRPKLTDPEYTQPMTLTIDANKVVTGSFYNSEILAGLAGSAQGRACVSFRTTDGQGLYQSSACLADGKMVGLTWAEGRSFVLPWTAVRTKK